MAPRPPIRHPSSRLRWINRLRFDPLPVLLSSGDPALAACAHTRFAGREAGPGGRTLEPAAVRATPPPRRCRMAPGLIPEAAFPSTASSRTTPRSRPTGRWASWSRSSPPPGAFPPSNVRRASSSPARQLPATSAASTAGSTRPTTPPVSSSCWSRPGMAEIPACGAPSHGCSAFARTTAVGPSRCSRASAAGTSRRSRDRPWRPIRPNRPHTWSPAWCCAPSLPIPATVTPRPPAAPPDSWQTDCSHATGTPAGMQPHSGRGSASRSGSPTCSRRSTA